MNLNRIYRSLSKCPHTSVATEPSRPAACVSAGSFTVIDIPNSSLLIPNWIRHPDHLGSSSWITYTDGEAVQHLHYLPWGEEFVDQRITDFSARHTFSAKERDAETGLSYFGARYYSSDLSIWLSVDPMSDKYPSLSPYVYCADNPVKLVDPNGCELWKPDEEGNLVAQQDDDYKSLAFMLNCSDRKAKKLLASQGYANGVKEGDKVTLDNQYTRSITAKCERRLTDEQAATYEHQWDKLGLSKEEKDKRFKELACPQDLYNCWSAAIAGANGLTIGPSNYDIRSYAIKD